MAVSSGGGHWVQLLSLRPAFVDCDLVLVTVAKGYGVDLGGIRFRVIPDCNRWHKFRMLWSAACIFFVVVAERPDVIVSTGAAPGYLALRFGKLIGAKTVWIDSVANAEALSMSGQLAGRVADLWLTQWEHLASAGGPQYRGSVL